MKIAINALFYCYKLIISPIIHTVVGSSAVCKYEESCSIYARRMLMTYGILYGSRRAVIRFLSCQSFVK